MIFKYVTHSPEETIKLAQSLGKKLLGGDIIAYRGGLGAGKTTFTRGVAIGMGLGDEVYSPTFSLVNEYVAREASLRLVHFDMYRITGALDLETTGFFDYMDDDTVIACEWSENIEDELPDGCIIITIDRIDDDTREITVEGDERFADLGN